jgi:Ser/Thr protein kinase RdoA (MazF antagonist)
MSSRVWGNNKTEFFDKLTPDKVLDAIELSGFKTTGRVLTLASMENRVFEVEVEGFESDNISDSFKIIKFYRPGRWSEKQIQDEHDFLFDLVANDIFVIAPIKIEGQSVFTNTDGLFYSIFPKKGGRACDEWTDLLLEQMGRLLARLHNTGQASIAQHRLKLDIQNFGENNLELILNSEYLPLEYKKSYESVCKTIFEISAPLFNNINYQRVHGDCHHGNIILNQGTPFLIDFDDMSMGPRVQDIWMVIPGRDQYSLNQRKVLLNAYTSMTDFNFQELKLIEPLRALRIIHFSAWIGHRFKDEAFKRVFQNFGTHQYWEKEIFDLKEQIGYIQSDLNNSYQY